MNKVFILLLAFVILFGLAGLVLAQIEITNPLSVRNFPELLTRIAWYVGSLIAVLGTIMIIVSGILFLTSAGSPERMTKAKTALIYAIAGIAIGLAATAISTVILEIIGA